MNVMECRLCTCSGIVKRSKIDIKESEHMQFEGADQSSS